ncbi:MAG TPA: molybdopterin-dependent oxidoreductase [Candidatus Thermoplasmatota archaeon]|nr:molybdopterin-dependent oxidoreductase [Candidatus Thermoplasmatota archaeon]
MKPSKPSVVLIVMLLVVVGLAGCTQQQVPLSGTEIREYQGHKLNSIFDMHQNTIKGAQYVNETTYRLHIYGLVDSPVNLTYQDITTNFTQYRKVATLDCVEGWSVTLLWEGPLVRDLLNESRPKPGATTLVFFSSDGFTTSVPFAYVMNNSIILAWRMNNVTIPPQYGFPFQLVAEGKWGYKWSKWVTGIEVIDNPNYKGFWESRGYSVSGDLNQSFSGG